MNSYRKSKIQRFSRLCAGKTAFHSGFDSGIAHRIRTPDSHNGCNLRPPAPVECPVRRRGRVRIGSGSRPLSRGSLQIESSATGATARRSAGITTNFTDRFDQLDVRRGDNSVCTLARVSVASSPTRIALVHGATEEAPEPTRPASLHSSTCGHRLILFAQSAHPGPAFGADTKPIEAASGDMSQEMRRQRPLVEN